MFQSEALSDPLPGHPSCLQLEASRMNVWRDSFKSRHDYSTWNFPLGMNYWSIFFIELNGSTLGTKVCTVECTTVCTLRSKVWLQWVLQYAIVRSTWYVLDVFPYLGVGTPPTNREKLALAIAQLTNKHHRGIFITDCRRTGNWRTYLGRSLQSQFIVNTAAKCLTKLHLWTLLDQPITSHNVSAISRANN